MTIRFYIVPIERVGSYRGPQYFKWRFNPDGIADRWHMLDYGLLDRALLASDISDANHTSLTAHSDVLALPLNLDAKLTAAQVNAAQAFLEGVGIPANWISTADTPRGVLRVLSGLFLFVQRVTALLGQPITLTPAALNLQVRNVPAETRAALAQAAAELGYDYAWVTANTTMRAVLKGMADAWGDRPILMGFVTL